jgi:hypothetical protein
MGQHNDEVYLKLLGLGEQRYAELKAASVI